MADRKDEIARIIAEAEQEAYARGVRDTIARMSASANELLPPDANRAESPKPATNGTAPSPGRGRPPSKTIGVVKNVVFTTPGLKGVEVVGAVHAIDSSIPERTIRTSLRRLAINKVIWKRSGSWYPKNKNDSGEAIGSPPH